MASLRAELVSAVRSDVRREQVQEAKKRAAAEGSDYERFKDLVSTAHLRPLNDHQSYSTATSHAIHAKLMSSLDPFVKHESQLCAEYTRSGQCGQTKDVFAWPHFEREWKRTSSHDARYKLLLSLCKLPPQRFSSHHMDMEFLGDVFEVIDRCYGKQVQDEHESIECLEVLDRLASMRGFQMSNEFMSLDQQHSKGRVTTHLLRSANPIAQSVLSQYADNDQ